MTSVIALKTTLFGVVLWFLAAAVIHIQRGLFDGAGGSAIALTVGAASGWLTVWLAMRITGACDAHALEVGAIGSVAAMPLDGLALTYTPGLYGGLKPSVVRGAGWPLWGVAWILVFAMMRARRAR